MINEQIALEREMAVRGVERYHRITDDAVAKGRESETTYAQRLIPEYVRVLAEAIEAAKTPKNHMGRQAKYVGLLKGADAEEIAFITLRYIFDSLVTGSTVNNLAINIGQRVEDQIRFSKFEEEHKGYYRKIIEDFKTKNTTEYRHMHRVMIAKSNDMQQTWNAWTTDERLHLGVKLLELTIECTGLITKVVQNVAPLKTEVRVVATPETMQWIYAHKENAEILHPECMPCIIPPRDWVGVFDGGYYTPEICHRINFVKVKSKAHRKAIKNVDFSEAMKSVNAIQQTAWEINTRVHEVIKEVWKLNLRIGMPASEPLVIPESPVAPDLKKENMTEQEMGLWLRWKRIASKTYTAERERFSKCLQLSRVLQMAEKYKEYKEFYYVYNCDFRGRIYCASPGLSPQGADFSKGLLHFASGKRLGSDGAYWLAVHGANTYGYDKDSYDGRRAWVDQHTEIIKAVASDPLSSDSRSFWSNADKPYQFLAFCFEWADYLREGQWYVSKIAVALDGSCNGLQNFSAMLRDSVGAKATNLCAEDKPQDIYQKVADVCRDRLMLMDDKIALQWLDFQVTRKCSKRPVMTLPYGSTRQSCREYIEDYIIDNIERSPWEGRAIFDASLHLSNIMWESISSVVVAARSAMDWLQSVSRIMSKLDIPLVWTTPTGFEVYQGSMKSQSHIVKTQLCGVCKLRIAVPTNEVDSRKQVLGIAPNFVHSMDASHLVKTVGVSEDITAWAMIHDSYGTYAADTPALHRFIRKAFVDMYTQHNVLQEFYDAAQAELDVRYEVACRTKDIVYAKKLEKAKLPDLPPAGDFNLNEVMNSLYFFG